MNKFIYKKAADITALAASFKDFKYKKHYHEEYALGVTLRGVQQYNLGGIVQSSYKNGVMLFNPQQVHDGMSHDASGIDYVMLYIQPELFLEMLDKKDIIKFSSPIVYNRSLEQSIRNIINAAFNNDDEMFLNELLLDLAKHFTETEINYDIKKEDPLIGKAKDMICANLDKPVKINEICQELSLSKFQFIRIFKACTGITPYQFYLNRKIKYAKEIIENKKDIYSAVADCGFVDLTHLNRHFKCIYGITPNEYLSNLN